MEQTDSQRLNDVLERLCEAGELPLTQLPLPAEQLTALGFTVSSSHAALPEHLELLDPERISGALSAAAAAWLSNLEVKKVTGSTNSELLAQAHSGLIDGCVKLAELQTAGRGRRGRQWLSPIGQNLALSIGSLVPLEPAHLGGLSLAVGLAVLDALTRSGATDVRLKWPNDVLLGSAKLAGILVELAAHEQGTQVVVGIGVNVAISAHVQGGIDQAVADLSGNPVAVSRNLLAARLISSVLDYLRGFSAGGFQPMAQIFNENHAYHEQPCQLLLGNEVISGTVRGVTDQGELLLEHADGIARYASGEVSLRPG